MSRGHPYTKEELALRKRVRAHSRYQAQKQQGQFQQLQEKIQKRELFARQQGKSVVPWTVEEELALLYEYSFTCSFCDEQKEELELTCANEREGYRISNMVPICYPCLIDKLMPVLPPLYILRKIAIRDLPEGFNKERLLGICMSDQLEVYVLAKLGKHDFEAFIGMPSIRYSFIQILLERGERLFEEEARSLFPQYKGLPYTDILA